MAEEVDLVGRPRDGSALSVASKVLMHGSQETYDKGLTPGYQELETDTNSTALFA